jgi:tetratricopeptide (TPR) repeat protein
MLVRALLIAAAIAPLFAQDSDVTKYLGEIRATSQPAPFDPTQAKAQIAEYTRRLDSTTDRIEKAHLYIQIAIVDRGLRDRDGAVAATRSAHELAPENTTVTADLAYLLAENGQTAEASAILGADAANGEALANRAEVLLDDRQNDLAVACLNLAQKLLPDDASIDDRLGVVYLRADKPDQAIRELNRAIAKAPGDALVHLHLAFAFDRKAYREYVRTELNTALDCHPTDEVRQAIEELRALLDLPR